MQNVLADHSMGPGETVMELNRRDMLKGAAVATAGSLTILTGAETASAATHPTLRVCSDGSQVLALQQRLGSLGYWLGWGERAVWRSHPTDRSCHPEGRKPIPRRDLRASHVVAG